MEAIDARCHQVLDDWAGNLGKFHRRPTKAAARINLPPSPTFCLAPHLQAEWRAWASEQSFVDVDLSQALGTAMT